MVLLCTSGKNLTNFLTKTTKNQHGGRVNDVFGHLFCFVVLSYFPMQPSHRLYFFHQGVQQSVQSKEPDLTKFQDIGSRLSKTVADDDVVIIEEIVQIIEVRWKKLKSRVETTAKDLFTGKEELEKFKTNMDNVEDWLTATETKLSNLESPSSKPVKIKEQIKELTVSWVHVLFI